MTPEEPAHWMELTTRYLDLDNGCFIIIEDDPDGGYIASVHVDDGNYMVIDAIRTEIEDKREAREWASSMFDRLRAITSNPIRVRNDTSNQMP